MISVDSFPSVLKLTTALGCGLMAGVFFTFSSFVMKALGRLPAEQGIAAMQSINVGAVTSWFLAAFLGTAALCVGTIILSVRQWSAPGAGFLIAGALSYLVGTFFVTMVFNVPMNNALAALAPDDPHRAEYWARYLANWTAWNHVRTLTSLIGAALVTLGLD
jgi:uncharacterized membrane protein